MTVRQPLLALAPQIQLQGTVHAIHPLVVPGVTFTPQYREHLAEAVDRIPLDHRLDCYNHRIVLPLVGAVVIHRPADADDLAGAAFAQAIRFPGMIDQFASLGRP
jgi:hypothetical protein